MNKGMIFWVLFMFLFGVAVNPISFFVFLLLYSLLTIVEAALDTDIGGSEGTE